MQPQILCDIDYKFNWCIDAFTREIERNIFFSKYHYFSVDIEPIIIKHENVNICTIKEKILLCDKYLENITKIFAVITAQNGMRTYIAYQSAPNKDIHTIVHDWICYNIPTDRINFFDCEFAWVQKLEEFEIAIQNIKRELNDYLLLFEGDHLIKITGTLCKKYNMHYSLRHFCTLMNFIALISVIFFSLVYLAAADSLFSSDDSFAYLFVSMVVFLLFGISFIILLWSFMLQWYKYNSPTYYAYLSGINYKQPRLNFWRT